MALSKPTKTSKFKATSTLHKVINVMYCRNIIQFNISRYPIQSPQTTIMRSRLRLSN